jgi:hypothetical protein
VSVSFFTLFVFPNRKDGFAVKKLLTTVLSASLVMVLGMSLVGCTPAEKKKDAPKTLEAAKDAPAKDAPAKDAPAKDAPAKDAPAKDKAK